MFEWCFHQLCFNAEPRLDEDSKISPYANLNKNYHKFLKWYHTPNIKKARLGLVALLVILAVVKIPDAFEFHAHCDRMAHQFSHPQIMYKARCDFFFFDSLFSFFLFCVASFLFYLLLSYFTSCLF